MDRVILHSDLNSFYASVECLYQPALRERPVAVSGDPDARHGIILTANYLAKGRGVKTGETIWQARQKCPQLVTLPPDFKKYLRFSRMVRDIYAGYTDRVEPFGIDEAWLDVTGSTGLLGSGPSIAQEIRRRVFSELGVTVSIGVSFNKVFAKLGSDYKKPDAVTVIGREDFRSLVWPLPSQQLLYVGPATRRKLASRGIYTIGGLARAEPRALRSWLGKMGEVLWQFANGLDCAPVRPLGEEAVVRSMGNSCTAPRDLESDDDVNMMLYILSDSVASRMREQGFRGRLVSLSVRDRELMRFSRQCLLPLHTCITQELAGAAMELFRESYSWQRTVRSLGVSVGDLVCGDVPVQMDLFCDQGRRAVRERLERTVDGLRGRFGHSCLKRAVTLTDSRFSAMTPKDDNIIHPVAFFGKER